MTIKVFKNRELLIYFILAFVFTWSISLFIILSTLGNKKPAPLWLHSFTAYGPFAAALIVEGIYRGKGGIKHLLKRIVRWKIGYWWFVISAWSLIFVLIFSEIISFLITGKNFNFIGLGKLDNLPYTGIVGAWLFSVVNSGIGEETGWRGFALPRLQKSESAFKSTIILSIIWALWHLPYFFYMPSYMEWGVLSFPGVVLALILGGFIFTWLYNSTKGSILAVAMWHGSFDYITTNKAATELGIVIACGVILFWGLLIPFVYNRKSLSSEEKQVI
jgi:CAAX protease family protein